MAKKLGNRGGEWNEYRDGRLRELWLRGVTLRGIADDLGMSAPHVETRSMILGLPPQPSVRPDEHYRYAHLRDGGHKRTCSFPVDAPERFFCGGRIVSPGKPYCLEHMKKAYVRPNGKRGRPSHRHPAA